MKKKESYNITQKHLDSLDFKLSLLLIFYGLLLGGLFIGLIVYLIFGL